MPEVSYVYPNLSQIYLKSKTMRGGLSERWVLAQETGCEFIELPGTLIKYKTEERLTSLNIGDFLSKKEISLLYTQDDEIHEGLKYILHTEPSLSKSNRFGRKVTSPINWHDEKWASRYLDMMLAITNYLARARKTDSARVKNREKKYGGTCVLLFGLGFSLSFSWLD